MKIKFISIVLILMLTIIPKIAFAEETPTNAVDSIKQKVLEKIETAKNNPTAFMGSITDISQNSIQIKDGKGEIKLISFNSENIIVVNTIKKSVVVKSNDLAIGDYIISMGYVNEKSVLEAKRILITLPTEKTKRSIGLGTISILSKKEITIKDKNGNEITVKFPAKWEGPETKELEIGYKVVIVSEADDKNNLLIRTIGIVNKTSVSTSEAPTVKDKLSPSPTKKISPTPTPK